MNPQVTADVEEIINNLLDQNKQLTLNNAVLHAAEEDARGWRQPDQSESVGIDEGLQSE